MTEWKERRRLAKDEKRDIGHPLWYSRGYIPHFDQEGLTQTLTFRLFDSMPQAPRRMARGIAVPRGKGGQS